LCKQVIFSIFATGNTITDQKVDLIEKRGAHLAPAKLMGFHLEANETTSDGLKRIVLEQIDKALRSLSTSTKSIDNAIHDGRVCLKKIRAVLRLVEFNLGEDTFDRENKTYRDAGRVLSSVRDSAAMVETIDKLIGRFENQLDPSAFANLRRPLLRSKQNKKGEKIKALAKASKSIKAARRRVNSWPLKHDGFSAVHGGLEDIYRRGRKDLSRAYDKPTVKNFHKWRKEVKSLRYEIRILREFWPELMKTASGEIDKLGDYLSDLHDLAILREKVLEHGASIDKSVDLEALVALIDQRSEELKIIAKPAGQRVYAEKPKIFARRHRVYWDAWKKEASTNPIAEG